MTLFIQQAKIHAPGIDSNRVKATCMNGLGNPLLDLEKQSGQIPVKDPAQHYRIIGKPMNLFHVDLSIFQCRQNRTATRCAKIKR